MTLWFAPMTASHGVFMILDWKRLKTFPWSSVLKSPAPFPCPHFDLIYAELFSLHKKLKCQAELYCNKQILE